MIWVDSCIICSVHIIKKASFQLKILVKWIFLFLLSITINYYQWKIYFHYHYRSKNQFWSSLGHTIKKEKKSLVCIPPLVRYRRLMSPYNIIYSMIASCNLQWVSLYLNKMGCFNDPAWKVCGGWVGVVGWWLTPTTYIQLAGAGSIKQLRIL